MYKVLLLALTLFVSTLCLGAEVYPARPVRVVVGFGPGSGTDIIARLTALQLTEQLGKTFVVDNRAGASGTIAGGMVAKSAADGYTLMVADTAWSIAPSLDKSVTYDDVKDFTAITQIMRIPTVLVVNPGLKVNTLREFIALAQASPGKLNFSSAGGGGALRLTTELFNRAAKVNIAHIPYSGGGGDAINAVIGGQVQMTVSAVQAALPHINSGRLRALAVTTDGKRVASLPDVPSMSEAGVQGMAVYVWFGLIGPAGMPKDIVNKLHAETVRALAVPSVKEKFVAQGGEVVGNTPDEFAALIRNEVRRWAEVIKAAGITLE